MDDLTNLQKEVVKIMSFFFQVILENGIRTDVLIESNEI